MKNLFVSIAIVLVGGSASAQPENYGPCGWAEMEPPDPPRPATVYYPTDAPGPGPIVTVVHGWGRTRYYHTEIGKTLASWGFVAVIPSLHCLTICDFDTNADDVVALMDLVTGEGANPESPLFGKVDGDRRGVAGHSNGCSVFMVPPRDPRTRTVVGIDPVDDGSQIASMIADVGVPSLHLFTDGGGCGSGPWEEYIYPQVNPPRMGLTVTGSYHCDPEDPCDALCPNVCGTPPWDHQKTLIFRRYILAWMRCLLQQDPGMAAWIDGDSLAADQAAGLIHGVTGLSRDQLPCLDAPLDGGVDGGEADAGAPDGGGDAGLDAGGDSGALDGGGGDDGDPGGDPGRDAGSDPGGDPGTGPADEGAGHPDSGDPGSGGDPAGTSAAGGCGCASGRPGSLLLLLILAWPLKFLRTRFGAGFDSWKSRPGQSGSN